MVKCMAAVQPGKQTIGGAWGKVGEAGETVGKTAAEKFTDPNVGGKAGTPRIPDLPAW